MKKIATLLAVVGLVMSAPVMAKSTMEISDQPLGERGIFSERAVIERITLAGKVCLEGEPCAAAAPSGPAPGAEPRSGEEIVTAVCSGCHASGMMGAPKIGNKGDWGPRIAKGKDTLHDHAIHGFNGKMPPKGGCASCSDEEIMGAVDFLISKAK